MIYQCQPLLCLPNVPTLSRLISIFQDTIFLQEVIKYKQIRLLTEYRLPSTCNMKPIFDGNINKTEINASKVTEIRRYMICEQLREEKKYWFYK